MFSTWTQRALLGFYIFLILSVPVGAYLASQRQNPKVAAKEVKPPVTKLQNSTPSSSLKELTKDLTQDNDTSSPTTTQATSFGPTLNLKLILEGRPLNKMASKIFVGIADAAASSVVKYLLSFNIDLPDSGEFKGLSLAGLSAGTSYKAVIKGPAQIATSSSFIMSATATNLNNNQPINLVTGDLNEDNVINSADYSIARAVFGTNSTSSNWNDNIDFNRDGIINSADISLIVKNMAKTGESGVWISTPATPSASLNDQVPIGSPSGGYWLWIPGF